MNRIDWEERLQHFVQVLAFCLVVATIQYGFQPDRPYGPPVVYSVLIGIFIWAIIDFGRAFLPSAADTGWPRGFTAIALAAGGITAGWFIGTQVADSLCKAYGIYPPGSAPADPAADLRNSILIALIAGTVATYYFYSASRSTYFERQIGEARRHADEARLKLLETQLEPHMLFNTLANLRALIGVDPPRAQQMLDHMIAYLRATLTASRSTTHALHAEFDRLRDYLELMGIRMGARLAFSLELPPELAQRPVPTLLLQPLVENSIQHGLEPQVRGGRITVSARTEAGVLVLEVVDTGVGTTAMPSQGQGFGLTQIGERLTALYGDRASFEFDSTPGQGTRARIRLPLDDA